MTTDLAKLADAIDPRKHPRGWHRFAAEDLIAASDELRASASRVDAREARPLSEYHEDMGSVLWWKFPITEAPYVGSPLDCGHTVEVHTHQGVVSRFDVGGWPGYHTHFTPIGPLPPAPGAAPGQQDEEGVKS